MRDNIDGNASLPQRNQRVPAGDPAAPPFRQVKQPAVHDIHLLGLLLGQHHGDLRVSGQDDHRDHGLPGHLLLLVEEETEEAAGLMS